MSDPKILQHGLIDVLADAPVDVLVNLLVDVVLDVLLCQVTAEGRDLFIALYSSW